MLENLTCSTWIITLFINLKKKKKEEEEEKKKEHRWDKDVAWNNWSHGKVERSFKV